MDKYPVGELLGHMIELYFFNRFGQCNSYDLPGSGIFGPYGAEWQFSYWIPELWTNNCYLNFFIKKIKTDHPNIFLACSENQVFDDKYTHSKAKVGFQCEYVKVYSHIIIFNNYIIFHRTTVNLLLPICIYVNIIFSPP